MFVDLREPSRLGEQRMPYDAFFILDRFFAGLAESLCATGGYYSTFDRDGLMALYGTTTDVRRGCRDAMRGAIATDVRRGCRDAMRGAIATVERLATINAALGADPGEPPRAGISIHAGEAIVGAMGQPATPLLSALGRGEPVTYSAVREPHLLASELAQ